MRRATIFATLLLTLSLFAVPKALEAQNPNEGRPEMPNWEFKDRKVENERWMSLYVEGEKAGSVHQTISKVKYNNKECYLFEEEKEIRFRGGSGLAKRFVTRRALTTDEYLLVAFETIDDTPGISIGDSIGLKIVNKGASVMAAGYEDKTVVNRIFVERDVNGVKKIINLSNLGTEELRPDFASVDIFCRAEMRRGIAAERPVTVLDTTNLSKITKELKYEPKVKINFKGGEREMGEIVEAGESYYLDEAGRLQAIRSQIYPVTVRLASGRAEALRPDGKDTDYKPEEALKSRKEYENRQTGVYLQRPHDDWALRTHSGDQYISYVVLGGIIDPIRICCWNVRNVPEGVEVKDAPKYLEYIVKTDTFKAAVTGGNFDISGVKAIEDGAGEIKRYAGEVALKDGSLEFKGKCYYFIKDDRAMAAICLVPNNVYDKDRQALMDRFADSVSLTKVEPLPAGKFESKKTGVKVESLPPSWSMTEGKGAFIDVKNSWFTVMGNISRVPRPADMSNLALEQATMTELRNRGYKDIEKKKTETTVDGIGAAEIAVSLKAFGTAARMKVILVLGEKYLYYIYLGTPKEIYEDASPEIDKFVAGLKLEH